MAPGSQAGAVPQGPAQQVRFNQQQAERIESSLGKDDSENLQLIADRMIGQQRAAAGFVWPLKIDTAPRGRHVRLTAPIQVKPAPITVNFRARRERTSDMSGPISALALFGGLLGLAYLGRAAIKRTGA
jgi:hypothetical protein